MAKGSAKKSFLDLFKITDSNDDDFDDDMFDDEDEMEDEYDDPYDEAYDSEEEYDDGSYAASDRAKASPLKSFNKYKNSRTPSGNVSKTKTAKSSQNSKLVSINSRSDRDSYDDSEVLLSSRMSSMMHR